MAESNCFPPVCTVTCVTISPIKIIAASVRHPVHVVELAKMGVDVATMPFKVIQQMATNPNTTRAVEGFLKDWEKVPK